MGYVPLTLYAILETVICVHPSLQEYLAYLCNRYNLTLGILRPLHPIARYIGTPMGSIFAQMVPRCVPLLEKNMGHVTLTLYGHRDNVT